MIIDVWGQQQTLRHAQNPIFAPLYLAILYLGALGLPLGVQAQDRQNYVILNYAEFEQRVSYRGVAYKLEGDGRSIGYGRIVNDFVDFEAIVSEYEYDAFRRPDTGKTVNGESASTLEASTYFKSPLSYRFTPFAVVGLIMVDSDALDESFEPYIGAGLDIRLSKNWDIRAAFKPFRGDIDADVYSIGPKYKF